LYVFFALFLLSCLGATWQLGRANVGIPKGKRNGPMSTLHVLIATKALLRGFTCLGYLRKFGIGGDNTAQSVLSALPRVVELWIFSLIIMQWSALVKQAKSQVLQPLSTPYMKCWCFLIANSAISAMTLVLFTVVRREQDGPLIASFILAVFWVVLGGLFCANANGIAKLLSERTGKKTQNQTSPFKSFGYLVVIAFVCKETIAILVVATDYANESVLTISTTLYFLMDILCMAVILRVYQPTITRMRAARVKDVSRASGSSGLRLSKLTGTKSLSGNPKRGIEKVQLARL